MKLDISKQTLQKIAIGVIVLVIIIFVVMKIWRSSRYTFPNSSEEGTFTINSVINSSGATAGTELTVTTSAPHGFAAGDLVAINGVSGVTFTQLITGTPPGATAGGAAAPTGSYVYITSIGTGANPTTFNVKGTVNQTITISSFSGTLSGTFTAGPVLIIKSTGAGSTTAATTAAATASATATVASGRVTGLTNIIVTIGTFTAGDPAFIKPSGAGAQTQVTSIATVSSSSIGTAGATVQSVVKASMTKLKTNDVVTCQQNYATALISAPSATAPSSPTTLISTGAAAARTLTLTNPTAGFTVAVGDKFIIPGVMDSNGKTAILVAETGSTSTSIIFTAASIPGTVTVQPSYSVQNITVPYAVRDTCITQATSDYTTGHCRYLPQASNGNKPIIPTANDDPVAAQAYSEYQSSIAAIQTAYAPAITRATQGASFPSGGTLSTSSGTPLTQAQQQQIVEAARKADLANATQKYLATACPGFYALTSGGTTTDLSSQYIKWSISTGATAPTVTQAAVEAGTSGKAFWAPSSGIPDTDIMRWAVGAGIVTLSGPVGSITIPAGGIGTGYPAGSLPGSAVIFETPPSGATAPTVSSVTVSSGKVTAITLQNGGSGYTTAPKITAISGGTVTQAELNSITVQLSTTLSATGPLVPAAVTSFAISGGATYTYSSTKYSTGTAGNENWRRAYKNGPGTYPQVTYT